MTETALPAIDIRGFPIQVRDTTRFQGDDLPKTITGRVLTYGTVDEYGTRWVEGCFKRSLETRLPPILWAHNPELPIGRTRSFRDGKDGLILTFELDDPEYVPQARQAAWQIKNRTVDEFSVGFVRRDAPPLDPAKNNGAFEDMRRADMLESSCVPFGAVSGTAVMGMRALYLANGVRMYVPDRERIVLSDTKPNIKPDTKPDSRTYPLVTDHTHEKVSSNPHSHALNGGHTDMHRHADPDVPGSKPEGTHPEGANPVETTSGNPNGDPAPDTSKTATGEPNPEGTNPVTELDENGNRIITIDESEINRDNDPITTRIKDNSTMVIKASDGKRKMVRVAQEPDLQSGIVKDRRAARIAAKKAEEARQAAREEAKRKEEARAATSESAKDALATVRKHRR